LILLVSVSFYPENSPRSFRATELAKEFCRQGHKVLVAGVDVDNEGNNQRKKLLEEYGIQWFSLGSGDWSTLYERWQQGGRISSLVARLLGYFGEFPSIEWYFKIPKRLVIPDDVVAVISIAKPFAVHWGLSRLAKRGALKDRVWLADCGDPFMLSTLNVRKVPFYFSYLEKAFCRRCDFIVTPTEAGYKGYYPEFREKIRVVPQGFNYEEERAKLGDYTENDVLTFVYAGAFLHKGRNPAALLKVLGDSENDFRFYIYTQQQYLVIPHIKPGDTRFIVQDIIPREDIMQVMRRADFLINMMNGTKVQMPSKLIDYYIVDRPVLNIEDDSLGQGELEVLFEFLNKDFGNRFVFSNMDSYHISDVCKGFVELIFNEKK
jgi:hypothetical protein